MKKTTIIILGLLFSLKSFSAVFTVNNRTDLPINPGQFTTIQSAVNAANSGDTLLVAGSTNNYVGFSFSKSLTIIGPGYNPDKQNPLTATINGDIVLTSANASNSSISGFIFNARIVNLMNIIINNFTIRRSYFTSPYGWSVDFGSEVSTNVLVTENVFANTLGNGVSIYRSSSSGNVTNFRIENNIFINCRISGGIYNNVNLIINHNLFIRGNNLTPLYSSFVGGTASMAITANSAAITNNIFYNVMPLDTTVSYTKSCAMVNNITYAGTTIPTMPYGSGCVGSGNINNTNPLLLSIFNTSSTLSFNLDNLRLQNSSPAHNTAADGSDIGPTGGLYPIYQSTNQYLTGEPTLPEIKYMNFVGNSATQSGGTLQINVKAKKIN